MIFVIITHVPHSIHQNQYFAYGPYVREMNIWIKGVEKLIIVAPESKLEKTNIDLNYEHSNIEFKSLERFDLLTLKGIFKTILKVPIICWQIYEAMKVADHIHLRCPGNVGLLGCILQMFFPKTPKTAKYAGNWDFKSPQPLSYRFQKWILSNTFLTKNIKVLVYGEWENSTKNIKPFFTASYFEKDKFDIQPRDLNGKISFLFVGTLSIGKQPLYAVQIVHELYKKGHNVQLVLYGEGAQRKNLEDYISENKLEKFVYLKGNQNQETVKRAFSENHFVILPSLSEGWPKVVAEGMFWGCLPISSKVSCLPTMLDNNNRGILLEMNLKMDVIAIDSILKNQKEYTTKVLNGVFWSRQYTLDVFENEINTLLHP